MLAAVPSVFIFRSRISSAHAYALGSLACALRHFSFNGSDSNTANFQTPPDSVRRDVEQSIASLNEMREFRAATIDTSAAWRAASRRNLPCPPSITERWIRTPRSGHEGWRYARRITVRPSCLACHGPKDERPAFVKKDYPEDRAHGFEDGDLWGIYAVFVPDTSVGDAL